MKDIITERQEEVLSYLCGLAPIGMPLQVKHRWLETDFLRMNHSNFNQLLKVLIRAGAVVIADTSLGATPSTLVVLRRPETFTVVPGMASAMPKAVYGLAPSSRRGKRLPGFDEVHA